MHGIFNPQSSTGIALLFGTTVILIVIWVFCQKFTELIASSLNFLNHEYVGLVGIDKILNLTFAFYRSYTVYVPGDDFHCGIAN